MGKRGERMEEGMLVMKGEGSEKVEKGLREKWKVVGYEVKKVILLAGPMVAVAMGQFLLQVISTMMVGHLGELYLSSTAIAISLCNVTGYSLLMGMASALETLCGQAFGAQQYRKVGTKTYTGMFCLLIVCVPISILWIYMGKVLVFIGQDPFISYEAGRFSRYLLPGLLAQAFLQPLVRYFQSQSLVMPLVISSALTICLHIPLCWAMVFKSGLQNIGAALAMGISMWFNLIFLATYMTYSSKCARTRSPLSMEIFGGIVEFFRFAIPSAVMICLEWWSFELLVLLSGILPHPELETSVLSICLTTITTLYTIPYGMGAAASTRISNEIGAGNPEGARIAVYGVLLIGVINALVISSLIFSTRKVFGYIFSSDKDVIDYVTEIAPLICGNTMIDSIQAVLSGVTRGCGWQHIGAFVNLGAYYLVGIPVGVMLGFLLQMRGKGLWIGILCGAAVQTILYSFITWSINWEKMAREARLRLFDQASSEDANETDENEQRLLAT